jgi:hypothetical protein
MVFLSIPERSKLYPIPLINDNSGLIESFPSYLLRLAAAHCLEFRTMLRDHFQFNHCYYTRPLQLPRLRNLIEDVTNLNANVNLKKLQFNHWNETFDILNLFRTTRQWCPLCLYNWGQEGKTLYEPFMWTFTCNNTCPIHHIKLVETCPSPQCNKTIYYFETQHFGYCPKCNTSLGNNNIAEISDSEQTSQSELLYQLIELSLQHPFIMSFSNLINLALHNFPNQKSLSEYLDIKSKYLHFWKNGTPPKLNYFLSRINKLLSSLTELFSDTPLNNYEHTASNYKHFNKAEIEDNLIAIIVKDPPSSLRETARLIGHNYQRLQYHFPQLMASIKERYKIAHPNLRVNNIQYELTKLNELLISELSDPICSSILEFEKQFKISGNTIQKYFSELFEQLKELYDTKRKDEKKYKSSVKDLSFDEISTELDKVIVTKPPQSLESTSKKLGFGHKILRELFEDKCNMISSSFLKYKKEQTDSNKMMKQKKVIEAIDQIHSENKYPSFRRVSKIVTMRTTELHNLWKQRLK